MKTKYMLFILVICLFNTNANSAELRIGLTSGVDFSSISKEDYSNSFLKGQKLKKIAIGMFFEQKFRYNFIKEEFIISTLGESIGTDFLIENKLKYLQINLILNQFFRKDKKTDLFFLLGPSLGINLSASQKTSWVDDKYEVDIDNIKKYDPAMIFGYGIHFNLDKINLNFEARYRFAFQTIFEDVDPNGGRDYYAIYDRDTGETLEWSNRTISILMQISFKIK